MDQLHLMTTFTAVADAGNLAGAARKLGLSAPAVTRAVAELEHRLGVRLLTRTTRVVRLTDAGSRYLDECRRILPEVEAAAALARGAAAEPQGLLMLTAPVLFGQLHVMPLVTEFLGLYPRVRAHCWLVDRVVHLVDEGMDVGVRIGELPDSSLQAIRVGQVRRVVCAAPAYLARCCQPEAPQDLAQHTVISASAVTASADWRFPDPQGGAEIRVRVEPRLVCTTNDAALGAAVAGFGITRLLSYQVDEHLRSGRLQPVLQGFEPAPLPVHLVHHEGRRATAKTRAFLDLAIERMRTNPALQWT